MSQTKKAIFYFDSYYLKASTLYMNYYKINDHLLVSQKN